MASTCSVSGQVWDIIHTWVVLVPFIMHCSCKIRNTLPTHPNGSIACGTVHKATSQCGGEVVETLSSFGTDRELYEHPGMAGMHVVGAILTQPCCKTFRVMGTSLHLVTCLCCFV